MLNEKVVEVQGLQNQMAQMQEQLNQSQVMHNDVQLLFDQGLLKQNPDGKFSVVEDASERESLA